MVPKAFPLEWAPVWDRLTNRQREVVTWLSRGLLNKQIAREMGISPQRVAQHIEGVARQLPGRGKPATRCRQLYAIAHGAST